MKNKAVAMVVLGLGMTLAGPTLGIGAEAAPQPAERGAPITEEWSKNRVIYGEPLSELNCSFSWGCTQTFEHAMINWNPRNGVRVLKGAESVRAFEAAGGPAEFGALEGDVFRHGYCGPSVTTYDGKTRWLIVISGDRASTALDLSSETARTWMAERARTRECFPYRNNRVDPSQLDWSQATQVFANSWELYDLLVTDTSAYLRESGWPQATVYEVPWAHTGTLAEQMWKESRRHKHDASGYLGAESYQGFGVDTWNLGTPKSNPVWAADTMTQEFSKGTVTWTRGTQEKARRSLLTEKELLEQGYKHVWGNTYASDAGTKRESGTIIPRLAQRRYSLYNAETGYRTEVHEGLYRNYLADPAFYGDFSGIYWEPDSGFRYSFIQGKREYYFEGTNGIKTKVTVQDPRTITYERGQQAQGSVRPWDIAVTEQGSREDYVPINPENIDWSESLYIKRLGIRYYQDHKTAWMIEVDEETENPREGAQAIRSDWLGYENYQDSIQRLTGGSSNKTVFEQWACCGNYGDTDFTRLGRPLANPQEIVLPNGEKGQEQLFQGGKIIWDPKNKTVEVILNNPQG